MTLTLLEAAKLAFNEGRVVEAAVIRQFAESSGILENIPFVDIAGNAYAYNREEVLPGVAFRGINETYTPSTGIVNPVTEHLSILGGDLRVDKFLIDTLGENVRSAQEAMQIRAIALKWENEFFNGDTAINPRGFDGLKKRLTGTQLISSGTTSGGDVLSLQKLDEAIDETYRPTHILLNKDMRRTLTGAYRNNNLNSQITWEPDNFGRQVPYYAGLPLLVIDEDGTRNKILPFTESGEGGGTAQCTSIYVVNMGEMGVHGLQNGGMQVRDLGELETQPLLLTRVEHYQSIAVKHGQAATRLYGIKKGAAVA